jgi:hypothetical protein
LFLRCTCKNPTVTRPRLFILLLCFRPVGAAIRFPRSSPDLFAYIAPARLTFTMHKAHTHRHPHSPFRAPLLACRWRPSLRGSFFLSSVFHIRLVRLARSSLRFLFSEASFVHVALSVFCRAPPRPYASLAWRQPLHGRRLADAASTARQWRRQLANGALPRRPRVRRRAHRGSDLTVRWGGRSRRDCSPALGLAASASLWGGGCRRHAGRRLPSDDRGASGHSPRAPGAACARARSIALRLGRAAAARLRPGRRGRIRARLGRPAQPGLLAIPARRGSSAIRACGRPAPASSAGEYRGREGFVRVAQAEPADRAARPRRSKSNTSRRLQGQLIDVAGSARATPRRTRGVLGRSAGLPAGPARSG